MGGSAAPQSLNVLVVDDQEPMRDLIVRFLRRMKIDNVAEASSGEEAMSRLQATTAAVDLVICDWNMPGMSGMEVFERVRATRPDARFLMLTGRADVRSVIAAKKAGVSGYIVKPVSADELRKKISFLIQGSNQNE